MVILSVVVLAGCRTSEATPEPAGVSGEVRIFAAASLAEAFDDLGRAFVRDHPDAEVLFNFAGSQTLASQIGQGAPADVFAAANPGQMEAVQSGGAVAGTPVGFASNRLAIAVAAGNPLGIDGLRDLGDPDILLVLPAEEVPAGQYARDALASAGAEVSPASLERSVRGALSKVELGEADATIVYTSDLEAAGDRVEGVPIATEDNVTASYPIATLERSGNPAAAEAFIDLVLSDEGQRILGTHGFGPA